MERTIPATWTMAEGLAAYLEENGFSREEYDAPYVMITAMGLTFPVPNPPDRKRAVRLHDLHHVLTGYGTDLTGEAEISAWELRRGLRGLGLYVRTIVTIGALAGLIHSPRRTLRAFRAAADGDTLFAATLSTDYPRLLAMTVGGARRELGLPTEGLRETHRLHEAAPASA